jgi:hypothetical protein
MLEIGRFIRRFDIRDRVGAIDIYFHFGPVSFGQILREFGGTNPDKKKFSDIG